MSFSVRVVCGINVDECDQFRLTVSTQKSCASWCPGTRQEGFGLIALGLPKGFNKMGFAGLNNGNLNRDTYIRLWDSPEEFLRIQGEYNRLNMAVWALEQNGYLFVRVVCPRVGWLFVDVIKGGTREKLCPTALDVAKFINEID